MQFVWQRAMELYGVLRKAIIMRIGFFAIVAWTVNVMTVHAEVRLASLFTDHAVLQRDKPIPVWGTAEPGEKVRVTLDGQSVETTASEDGGWYVELSPRSASIEPKSLEVLGSNRILLSDILIGDVWLASGQSNMAWPVRDSSNARAEIAHANHPVIREFKVKRQVAEKPVRDVDGQWAVCSPETVGEFSAVAYYFARYLNQKVGVPIGIINSSWGGTQIESWMGESALRADARFSPIFQRYEERVKGFPEAVEKYKLALETWQKEAEAAVARGETFRKKKPKQPEGAGSRWMPASLFNGMIYPLIPYGLRGIIWYQGEANAPRASEYGPLLRAMIRQWRKDFQQGDLPFYFVQLPELDWGDEVEPTGQMWAFQREAMASVTDEPNVGMAVTIGIGDSKNIHPKNKQEVGRRLALLALAGAYERDINPSGPGFGKAILDGSKVKIPIRGEAVFKFANGTGFEVAGEDRKFYPAHVVQEEDFLIVSSPEVPCPVAVRYAWKNNPKPTVFSPEGLPAPPYRSDDWPAPYTTFSFD